MIPETLADEVKKKIEASQRERINERKASGMEYAAKHFVGTEAGWVYKHQAKSGTKKKPSKNSDLEDSDSDSDDDPPEVKEPLPPPGDFQIDRSAVEVVEKKKETDEEPEDGEESPQDDKKHLKDGSSNESTWSKIRRRGGSRSNSMVLKKEEVLAEMKREGQRFSVPEGTTRQKAKSPNGHSETLSGEVNIIKGWMKMRNSMKIWINRWFVLRPGKLIYYKDEKVGLYFPEKKQEMVRDKCAGILRLADCKVKERPTNKDGFSFKIYQS